jgi:GSH-dependent disulfide-bond oxidoreductase
VHHFIALENEQDRAYGLKRFMAETRRLYAVLDRRLSNHEFVADTLSVADFAILGWAWRHPRHKVELSDFPKVKRWYDQMMARPGVMRGMEAKLD